MEPLTSGPLRALQQTRECRYDRGWRRVRALIGRPIFLVGLLVGVLGYLIIPPLLVLGFGSVTDSPPGAAPSFTLDTLIFAYGNWRIYPALLKSLAFAAITATLVLCVGTFLAWAVERTDSSAKRFVDLLALTPVLMPAVLLVSGWIMLIGPRSGLLNLLARDYLGVQDPVLNIYSFPGMVWVCLLQEIPLAFLWLWPAFRSMNPELEEAGLASGATMFEVFHRITLPILRPTFLAAWIIFFIYTLGALSVPLLIGLPAKIFLYPTEIYLAYRRIPTDLNLASAYSLLFLLISIASLYLYQRATIDANRFVTVTGRGYRPRLIRLGRYRFLVTSSVVLILVFVALLPMSVLIWNSFMPFPQAPSWRSLSLLTTENYVGALNNQAAQRAVVNSMGLGLAAGLITAGLGGLVAWCTLRLRKHPRLTATLDQMASMPIAVPGIIFGVGLMWLYLILPPPIYGSYLILLLAYIAIHMPFAVRICASGLSQIHPELEEAAYVSGASWMATMRRVVIRLLAPAMMAAALYVALRSFREYQASIFLTAPGTEVFAVLVLDLWESGSPNTLSAYVCMVMVVLGVAAILSNWLGRRAGVRL